MGVAGNLDTERLVIAKHLASGSACHRHARLARTAFPSVRRWGHERRERAGLLLLFVAVTLMTSGFVLMKSGRGHVGRMQSRQPIELSRERRYVEMKTKRKRKGRRM